MDYKEKIVELVEKITKKENLEMLYGVAKTMQEYEEKQREDLD